MSIRSYGRAFLKTAAHGSLRLAGQFTPLQRLLFTVYARLAPRQPWMKPHPFDLRWGTDTSGFLPAWMLRLDGVNPDGNPYAGCHPACLRAALGAIPDLPSRTFVDLGCGKGRALVVASEFPFKQIAGIELSAPLVQTAGRNAQAIRAAHPSRPPITAVVGDAAEAPLPTGSLVVFCYHSFSGRLFERICARLDAEAAGPGREIFFVYANPVCAGVFDAAAGFRRWFAGTVPCEAHERGFAADDDESVVIWRAGGPPREPHANAQAAVALDANGHAVVAAPPRPAHAAEPQAALRGLPLPASGTVP